MGTLAEDLHLFCRLDLGCHEYGPRGAGNIAVRDHYAPHDGRLLYCKTCERRSSERKGTPRFDCRLDESVGRSVLAHLRDGCGVRQTERLVGIDRDTVMRLARNAGSHAKDAHDDLVGFSPLDHQAPTGRGVEFRRQEGEERKFRERGHACRGEQWEFVAVDPDSPLVPSLVGERAGETAVMPPRDVKRRPGGRVPESVKADEWSPYPAAVREVFGEVVTPEPTSKPGRPAGPRVGVPPSLDYATVDEAREEGRVAGVATRVAMGLMATVALLPGAGKENATTIEGQNAPAGSRTRGRGGRHATLARTGRCTRR